MKPLYICTAILLLSLLGGGQVLAQKGKKGKAAKELSYEDQLKAKRFFLNATRARLLGNQDEAKTLFEKCLKLDPSNHAALYELAKIHEQGKATDAAISLAEQAVELDGSNVWYRFLLADLYLIAGQTEKATDALRAIIDLEPEKYEVYFELSRVYVEAGQYDKALKVYEDLQGQVGMAEEVVMQRYHLLVGLGELQEATTLIESAVQEFPNDPRYRGVLAELYDQLGRSEDALAQYNKVLELDPGNSMIHLALAEHYRVSGKDKEAFEELRLAYQDPEVDIDTKVQILLNFYEITELPGADPAQQQLLLEQGGELMHLLVEVHPNNARSYSILGDYQMRENKLAEARDSFRKAVELEPDKFVIWHQVILLSSQLNDQRAVQQESAEAMELFPTMPVFYFYHGSSLNLDEKPKEALDVLFAGKDLVVEDPLLLAQFYSGIGDSFHAMEQHEDSDKYYDKSLQHDPDNIYVLNNYSYYLSLRNQDLEKAAKMSKRSNDLQPGQASFQDTYAWVLYKLGRYEEARTWVEKALENGGDNSGEVLEHYGDILYKLGDEEGALDSWQKAKLLGKTSDLIDKKISDRQLYE